MFDLSGRVALVTGGGFGIGRSICEGLAECGADVAVADINEELAKETAGLLSGFGHKSMSIKADVTSFAQVESMVKETVAKFGTIDIMVNNAGGIMGLYKIHETPEELWDKVMSLNFILKMNGMMFGSQEGINLYPEKGLSDFRPVRKIRSRNILPILLLHILKMDVITPFLI